MKSTLCKPVLVAFLLVLSVASALAQEPETGTVIFFRKLRTSGILEGFKMYYNDSVYVGNIKNGRYIVFECPAGAAYFSYKQGAKTPIELAVEPGKTYYMECILTNNYIRGTSYLYSKYFVSVDYEKGERIVKRLKESKPNEPDTEEN